MTQEDKKLLLIDLCERLPYGVEIQIKDWATVDTELKIGHIQRLQNDNIELKPYLRSIEDITEEEAKEVKAFYDCDFFDRKINIAVGKLTDWLNANHFDYRNLIPKSLAIRVTKENNPYKN